MAAAEVVTVGATDVSAPGAWVDVELGAVGIAPVLDEVLVWGEVEASGAVGSAGTSGEPDGIIICGVGSGLGGRGVKSSPVMSWPKI